MNRCLIYKCDCACDGWLVKSPLAQRDDLAPLWFNSHAEALAYVLAQPEVRRRTSSAARAGQQIAEALS